MYSTGVSSIRSDNSLSSVARGLMDTSGGAEEYVDASSSPLHIAAARGEISTIRSLLGRIHIDEVDGSGRTVYWGDTVYYCPVPLSPSDGIQAGVGSTVHCS